MKVKKLVIILGIMIRMNTVLVLGEDFINGEMELTREENTQAEELDRIGLSNGTYEYCIKEDDTITITKYIGSESYIIVPETIDGKIVNTIEKRTFEGNDEVKRIEISKTIPKHPLNGVHSMSA